MDKSGGTRILIVDDEQDLRDILSFNLMAAGYDVQQAASAEEAWQMLGHDHQQRPRFSLVLLDVMMEGMSGFQLAEMLRNHQPTAQLPIIFLTAKDTEDDMLRGFHLGADDYIAKPFSVRELMARVRAVLHRTAQMPADTPSQNILCHEGLLLNLNSMTVSIDGCEVAFTRTEFELLRLLFTHRGQVFSRQELIESVWPSDVVVTNRTVDVNITRLRKKIGSYATCIATRQGFGYYFKNQPS